MAHKNLKNTKLVVVKSTLKFLVYKPEAQQTDLTAVNETRQNSQVGHLLVAAIA